MLSVEKKMINIVYVSEFLAYVSEFSDTVYFGNLALNVNLMRHASDSFSVGMRMWLKALDPFQKSFSLLPSSWYFGPAPGTSNLGS